MRILHLLDHSLPLQSGYTTRSHAILTQQRALGWEVAALTAPKHHPDGPNPALHEGIPYYRTPSPPPVWSRLPVAGHGAAVAAMGQRLLQVAREFRPHLLHAHSPALNGLAALAAGRRLGIPVVYEVRAFWEDAAASHGTSRDGGVRYRLTRALEGAVARRADGVVVICQGLGEELVARGVPPQRLLVVPNGVDPDAFPTHQPSPHLRRRLGLEDRTVLGFLGSFYGYEGLDQAVAVLPRILQEFPQVRLLLVGGGPEEAALRRQAAALGVEGEVLFTGRVPHSATADYYALVDICLYPRLPMRLTRLVTPLKPLEALASGKLVLLSDVGGHRELLEGPSGATFFPAGDPAALTSSLLQLLAHPRDWPQLRERGRAFATQQRTWRQAVARYQPFYANLVTGLTVTGPGEGSP